MKSPHVGGSVLSAHGLIRAFQGPPGVAVLHGVDLDVRAGERVAILGRSGAGKSTLLNILGLLDRPDSGNLHLTGCDALACSPRERDRLRARALGFVFQAHHVLGHRSSLENVLLKLATIGSPVGDRQELAHRALAHVGLDHRAFALGRTLSGGEKQRLAFARAVVASPSLLLADEPTGNLDDDNTDMVLALAAQQAERGSAVIVITHDERTARWADSCYRLANGRLHSVRAP